MTEQAKARKEGSPLSDVVEKIPALRPGTSEVVSYDGSVATSTAFGTDITVLRIVSTTDCWYQIGSSPTATVGDDSHYLPAKVVEYVAIIAGSDSIAFIKDTGATAGSACVSQCGGAS